MRGGDVNFTDAVLAKDFDRLRHRAGGGDHVIDDHHIFTGDIADHVFGLGGGAALSAFVDETEFAVEHFRVNLRALDVTDIGADENAMRQLEASQPFSKHRAGVQMIDGNIKKSLHLGGMKIDA